MLAAGRDVWMTRQQEKEDQQSASHYLALHSHTNKAKAQQQEANTQNILTPA